MSLLALAIAAEIGAGAPPELKPCEKPAIDRQAKPGDPQYARMTHIRKLPTCGEAIGPLAILFPPKDLPLDYSPAPEQETFAAAQMPEAVMPGSEAESSALKLSSDSVALITSGSAAFITGPVYTPAIYVSAVPEPYTVYMVAVGLLALVWRARA